MSPPLELEGSNCLRQRLVLSTLSGRPVQIRNIRVMDEEPGLRNYEKNLIELLFKVCNGTMCEVDETGTEITFKPGVIVGGQIEHDCDLERSISYYLEVLFCLAPFAKYPWDVTLNGITNDDTDASVEALKYTSIPVLKKFLQILDATEVEIKVKGRGMKPDGGGTVLFKCPIRRYLKPIQFTEAGKIKRIRGTAFATRVSPQIANRIVDSAKGLLLKFIPDVYIHTDHLKGQQSGKSPGFGLILMAETTNGTFYTGEAVSNPKGSDKGPSIPEDVAKEACYSLFEEIYRGGCVDSLNQSLTCLFMSLGQNDLSKVEFGPLSPYTVQFLRHMKTFLQVTFKLEVVKDVNSEPLENVPQLKKGSQKIMASCLGIGFTNLSKTVT